MVGDPAHLSELYATPTDAFLWGHRLNVLRFFVGDESIIVSDGDDHRRRRGVVQPGFARRRLDGWVPMIVDEADRTIDATIAPSQGVIDLFPVGRRLVLRVVINALFGTGFSERAAEIDGLIEPAKTYLEQSLMRQLPHPLPFTRRARARDARRRFDRLVDDQIARRRTEARTDSGDVLDLLLASGGLSDSEIRDQVVTLIAAGYDTTASSIAWTLTRAVGAPGVWDRLRAEADAVLGPVEPGRRPCSSFRTRRPSCARRCACIRPECSRPARPPATSRSDHTSSRRVRSSSCAPTSRAAIRARGTSRCVSTPTGT